MSEKPALNLTLESLGREIATAATNSRAFDQQLLARAAGIMEAVGGRGGPCHAMGPAYRRRIWR